MTDEILTPEEIAKELRCSKAHVYKILNGEVAGLPRLPHLPLGRKKVVRRSSFDAWKVKVEHVIVWADQVNALDAETRTNA